MFHVSGFRFHGLLIIRLQRTGKKKQAYFRIVVQEHSQKTKGKFLESLGNLDPHANKFTVKSDRVKYWISHGAQVSDSVWNRLVDQKLVDGPKRQIVRVNPALKFKDGVKKQEAEEKTETVLSSVPAEAQIEPVISQKLGE
ncbi:MAG: 30S ribosomal protein S16 [Parcubacteria group bacterium]|nr:30S ribosomal protein S16 [Parcubacteria group bacterium]